MRYEKSSKVELGLEFWVCATKPLNPATGKRCGGRLERLTKRILPATTNAVGSSRKPSPRALQRTLYFN